VSDWRLFASQKNRLIDDMPTQNRLVYSIGLAELKAPRKVINPSPVTWQVRFVRYTIGKSKNTGRDVTGIGGQRRTDDHAS